MLLLEFSLGQNLQKGDICVWSELHPRLTGIGLTSVVASFAITFYYNVIIGWAVLYFFAAFKNPLPWSIQNTTNELRTTKSCPKMYITQE
jgi:SNF family Na+-dependent transporter